MAGYWPSSFFCVFMDTQKHAKKELGQYPAILTEQAWSIKDLLYGIKHQNMISFPCGSMPVSRVGKIAPSCPSGSQSQREIRFILPAHIIIDNYSPKWRWIVVDIYGSTTFTDTEVNNCFSIFHTRWITSGPKSNFTCLRVTLFETGRHFVFSSAARRCIVLG